MSMKKLIELDDFEGIKKLSLQVKMSTQRTDRGQQH